MMHLSLASKQKTQYSILLPTAKMPKRKKILFADVFAGCGGLSLGLMQAGLVGRFAVERDRFAFETLLTNLVRTSSAAKFSWPRWLPKKPISVGTFLKRYKKNLRSLKGSIDVLVGGPPCQGFSMAGRREHDDPRNKLFASYLRIVDLIKPRIVLLENVRGFTMDFNAGARAKNYSVKLRKKLEQDYDVYESLLDLSEFGVPQQRTRYFLLAVERGLSSTDPFELLKLRLPSFLRRVGIRAPVSSWCAISDLEILRCGTQQSSDTEGFREIKYVKPRTSFQKVMAAVAGKPNNLRLARHGDDISERFKEIIDLSHKQGRLNISINDEIRSRYGLKKKALRVLDPDRPSPTITSMPDDLLHYAEPRTLTVRENARLQSFPDWFDFKGKYTTGGHLRRREVPRFTQVANAVPPLVAMAIGELIVDLLSKKRRHQQATSGLKSAQQISEVLT